MRNCNSADLGTRLKNTPQDIRAGSEYQGGMDWMKKLEAQWPCNKSFGSALAEEMRKDMVAVASPILLAVKNMHGEKGEFPKATRGGLDRLLKVYGYVFTAIYKWRKKGVPSGPCSSVSP
jgi:hypothetical protein